MVDSERVLHGYQLGRKLGQNRIVTDAEPLKNLLPSFQSLASTKGEKSFITDVIHTAQRNGIATWGQLMDTTGEEILGWRQASETTQALIYGLTGALVIEERGVEARIRLSVALASTLKLMRGDFRLRGNMSLPEVSDEILQVLDKTDQTRAVVKAAAAKLDQVGLRVRHIQGLTLDQVIDRPGVSEVRYRFFQTLLSKD